MMRARDSAFMVDHRRQLSLPPPGVAGAAATKKDEVAKKKKAGQHLQHQRAQQKAAQPPPESSASGKAPGPLSVKKSAKESGKEDAGAPVPTPSSKKTPSKQQLKRERKEKAAKAAAAVAAATGKAPASQSSSTTTKKAASSSPAASTATPAKAAQVSSQASERSDGEMEQDGLKSRNHKMVLAPSRSLSAMHFPSWRTRQQSAFATHSVADRLHDEILEYTNYTKATVERMRVHIEEMIVNVRECVHSLWPQSKVETFGSYSTGIWLPSSDVDLVVLDVVEVIDSKKTVKHLRELAKVLESKSWVESIVVLETAKIPVLKLVSAESSVPIDVTFESAATHSGLLARDLIKRYAEEIPELYPLAILFKQLLRERGLNDAYTGGLSSYSVVLMLIHFSQLRRNGQLCFEAAAVYASGSLPPLPSSFSQLEKAGKSQEKADVSTQSTTAQESQPKSAKQGDLAGESSSIDKSKKPAAVAPPAVSYTALLVRPTATSGQSSVGKDSSALSQEKRSPAPSKPRFSYADVAAGVVKVTAPAPPPSYAAALTAKPGTYDMSAKTVAPSSSSSARAPGDVGSKESKGSDRSAKTSSSNDNTPSDAVSVSSSSADTEESTSSVASTASSAADSDDEASKSHDQIHERDQDEAVPVSLGEHTLMILEFFGILFDYRKNGLSIRDGGYIYRLAENRRSEIGKPALVIEDPIHPDRNVSASSFAFSKVVAVFEDSFYALKYYRPSKFVPTALSCLLSCSGHTIDLPSKKID